MRLITKSPLFKIPELDLEPIKPKDVGKLGPADNLYLNAVMPMIWVELNDPSKTQKLGDPPEPSESPVAISWGDLNHFVGYPPNLVIWQAIGQILADAGWYVEEDDSNFYHVWKKNPKPVAELRQPPKLNFELRRPNTDRDER